MEGSRATANDAAAAAAAADAADAAAYDDDNAARIAHAADTSARATYADARATEAAARAAEAAARAADTATRATDDAYDDDYYDDDYDGSYYDDAAHAAEAATRAAYAACAGAVYTYTAARVTRAFFENILYEDIEAIKTGNLTKLNNNTNIYGAIWQHFLEDLNNVGCGYWIRLYENLFKNKFDIDKKELERRLNVPDEIKERGAAAVGQYLERLGDDAQRLNEARIIILGEKGAGKTSLARRLNKINAKMPEEYESTEGVDTSIWQFPDKDGNKKINAYIWDFAGHSITHSAHRCFMSARCLYIYVYDGREEQNNVPAYWLEQIRIHGGDNSPVLFLINKKDGRKADIPERTLKKEYPSIEGYYRVDVKKEKATLGEFRRVVMEKVRNNPSWNNQIVSAEAYKIKSELCELFDRKKSPHITREQFDAVAKKYGVDDTRIEGILEDLHTLGICLWYKEEKIEDFDMLVLNPDWITNGIYRIINKGFEKNKRKLSVQDGVEMLKNDERYKYQRNEVAFLFRLMRVYELAYFEDNDRIFIPGILSIDSPDGLPDFPYGERLTMSFAVDKALPPNMVCRLIVLRHKEVVGEEQMWRRGVVLRYSQGDATAVIVEDGRSINVQVKGADKTAYLASLRETLTGIFDSYKDIKPDLSYEVLLPAGYEMTELPNPREKAKPLMVLERVIRGCLRAARAFFDADNDRDIPLDETQRGYRIAVHGNVNTIHIHTDNSVKKTSSTRATANVKIRNCVINFPPTVNKKIFVQTLEMLTNFLNSNQAKKLMVKDSRELQKVIDEVRKLGHKTGWDRLRGHLATAADFATLGSPLYLYLAAHPEIPQAVLSMFGVVQ